MKQLELSAVQDGLSKYVRMAECVAFLLFVCLALLSGCESASTLTPDDRPVALAPAPNDQVPRLAPTVENQPPRITATPDDQVAGPAEMLDGAIARQHLLALSAEIGPRWPGSDEDIEAVEYITTVFEELGYEPKVQHFDLTTEDDEELESANIIAVKPGSSFQEIIIGAHYDSGDEAEGADDNASGVAVLLAVAEHLQDEPTPYAIRFIAFGAEEVDLNGSHYYVDQMSTADIHNTIAMVNLDSLIAGDIAYVNGDDGQGSLRDWILQWARQEDLELEGRTAEELDSPDGTPCDCADYDAFQEVGIPFVYFEATNWNLGEEDGMTQVDPLWGEEGQIRHTEYDTLEYIDETFPGRVDRHLSLFITLLYDMLTQFEASR